jgi:HSP20 family protein
MTDESIEVRRGDPEAAVVRRGGHASGWSYKPRIDVTESEDAFAILTDLPGVGADDIDMEFANGLLTIHGRVPLRQDRGTRFIAHEYGIGDFDREVFVSEAVNAAAISATLANGVLTVTLPKSEEAKPRKITVRPA